MSKPTPLSVSVSKMIAARPETVYDLIADVTRMSSYSPETVRTKWLGDDTGPAVGARFKGTNVIGRTRWSTAPTITAADRGVRFAFQVPGSSGPLWTYEFTATDGGTLVTESMSQQKSSPLIIRMMRRGAGVTDRAEHLRQGMIVTLDRLSTAAVSADLESVQF